MTDYFRRCEDGHRCENGSFCKEDPNQEGSYYCDCSTAVGGKFAGLYCEYEAQTECKFASDVEASWFCVNNGECNVVDNFWTCQCNNNFEGPHCEFINGAVPEDWPIATRSNVIAKEPQEGMGGGAIAGIVIAILVVFAVASYIVYKKRKGEDWYPRKGSVGQNAPRDQSEALAIDADGSVLRESVKAMSVKTDENGFPVLQSTPENKEANHANGHSNSNGHSNGHTNGDQVSGHLL